MNWHRADLLPEIHRRLRSSGRIIEAAISSIPGTSETWRTTCPRADQHRGNASRALHIHQRSADGAIALQCFGSCTAAQVLSALALPATLEVVDDDIHPTDTGNARCLVQLHGPDIRFVDGFGWLVWDGQRFKRDDDREIFRRALDVPRSIQTAWPPHEDSDDRKRRVRWGLQSESTPRLKAMVEAAASIAGVVTRIRDFDCDPWLLNVANGTVDLRTGQLRPHSREDLISKLAPVSYEPQAQCPTWLRFLRRVLSEDDELISFLQRWFGYSLTGLTQEQKFCILWGQGANGKSTLLETLRYVLGDYCRNIAFDTLAARSQDRDARPDLARLIGSRLVTAVEAPAGRRFDEVLIKQLTGEDMFTVRELYRSPVEYRPAFKITVAANHQPEISPDPAVWRRVLLVPFTVMIPVEERDPHLAQALRGEAPGILRWLIEGCIQWNQQGLGMPARVQEAVRAYQQAQDVIGGFLETATRPDPRGAVTFKLLFERYRAWAADAGEEPLNSTKFGRLLTERGIGMDKRGPGGTKRRLGLKLVSDDCEQVGGRDSDDS